VYKIVINNTDAIDEKISGMTFPLIKVFAVIVLDE